MFFVTQVSELVENINIVIYSDTVNKNIINVKLRLIALLIELYPLIPLSVTLTIFQGHSSVEQL